MHSHFIRSSVGYSLLHRSPFPFPQVTPGRYATTYPWKSCEHPSPQHEEGRKQPRVVAVCPLDALEPLEAFPGVMGQTRNEFQEIHDIRQRSGLSETALTCPSLFLLTVKAILLPQTAALTTFAKPNRHHQLGKKKTKGKECCQVLGWKLNVLHRCTCLSDS